MQPPRSGARAARWPSSGSAGHGPVARWPRGPLSQILRTRTRAMSSGWYWWKRMLWPSVAEWTWAHGSGHERPRPAAPRRPTGCPTTSPPGGEGPPPPRSARFPRRRRRPPAPGRRKAQPYARLPELYGRWWRPPSLRRVRPGEQARSGHRRPRLPAGPTAPPWPVSLRNRIRSSTGASGSRRWETRPMSFLTEPWCHAGELAVSLLGNRRHLPNGLRTLSGR